MLDQLPPWIQQASLNSQLPAWMQDPPPKKKSAFDLAGPLAQLNEKLKALGPKAVEQVKEMAHQAVTDPRTFMMGMVGTGDLGPAAAPAGRLLQELLREGGATLTKSGKPFAGTAYMVADPALTLKTRDPAEIAAFIKRPDVQAAIKRGGLFGKWVDPESKIAEINVSHPFASKADAFAVARQRNEKAIGHIHESEYKGDIRNKHYVPPKVGTPAIRVHVPGEKPQIFTGAAHPFARLDAEEKLGNLLDENFEPRFQIDEGFLTQDGKGWLDRQEAYASARYHKQIAGNPRAVDNAKRSKQMKAEVLKQGETTFDEPEKIVGTVTKYGGKEYDGIIHAEGIEAAKDEAKRQGMPFAYSLVDDNYFRTSTGRLVGRKEARQIAEAAGQNPTMRRAGAGRENDLFAEALPEVREQLPFYDPKETRSVGRILRDQHTAPQLPKTAPELEAYGQQHGVPGLGKVSEPVTVKLTDGRTVSIPGGTKGKFSYHDLLSLKAQGINPNLLPEGMHEKIHAKMMRSMTPANPSDEDIFRGLLFGITSPNSPLTPNEFTVSRFMPRNMDDIKALAKKDPATVAHEFGVDAGKKGGLGTSGSVDYAQVVNLAKMFSEDPKWFRRAASEPWDRYVDRISTQVPGLGTKTASLGGVWQDLPNAAVSAVDRHMTELAMPHILKHPELGPDFRRRAVSSWNAAHPDAQVKTLEQIRKRDPIFARDFLASLINDPQQGIFKNAKGQFGPNVPEWAKALPKWMVEPEKVVQMNPYYREALKYNAGLKGKGESLFESQWRLWDKQRGRIEPHEVMYPGLNKLPRMPLDDARRALGAHKAAGYTLGRPTVNNPVAMGGQLPAVKPVANPMDLAYWGLGGLLLGGGLSQGDEPDATSLLQ